MADLERFETDLTALIYLYDIDNHVGIVGADHVARRLMEFIKLMKDCHEFNRDIELSLAPERFEPLLPDTGATVARHRTVHIGQRPLHVPDGPLPEPAKIEALPATEDWCACGWSEEPHLRTEHEPAGALPDDAPTPPHATCGRFVSQRGAFATGPDDLCVRCGASGRAHGITRLGPPSQIAETLTPLED